MQNFDFTKFLSTKSNNVLTYREYNNGAFVKFFIYKAGVKKLAELNENFNKQYMNKSSATFKTYTTSDAQAFRDFLKKTGFVAKIN